MLKILAFCVALRYLSTAADVALMAIDRMKEKVVIQAIVALSYILLNLALIPRYSLYGTATATLLSEALLLALFLRAVGKHLLALSIRKDLSLDRLCAGTLVLAVLAILGRGRLSDYLMAPLLVAMVPLVMRMSKFVDWRLSTVWASVRR